MTKILVTGGAGYIGQVLCQELYEKGYDITILDDLLYEISPNPEFNFIKGNILNVDDIKRAMKGVTHVVHLAAIANDPATDLDPQLSQMVNFESVKLLKKHAIKNNVERFLFSSSCSVYGDTGDVLSNENSQPSPITLYGQLKVSAEKELLILQILGV